MPQIDTFDEAFSTLVNVVANPSTSDADIERRAKTLEILYGPKYEDLIALAMADVAVVRHKDINTILREFPDYCRRNR